MGIENLAVERAKQLFGADYVNVRFHSVTQANISVYSAVLKPGDTVLRVNFSCEGNFNFIDYEVEKDTGCINYENVFGIAFKHKPKLIIAGTYSYPRKIDFFQLQEVAEEVGAMLMVDMSCIVGLVAAGLYPSPIPYADFVTTTTAESLRGPEGGVVMCKRKYASLIDKAVLTHIKGTHMLPDIAGVEAALKEAFSQEFKAYQEQTVKKEH